MKTILVLSVLAVLMIFGCLGQKCPDTYDPVCGSDGVTYPNSCQATQAGAMVKSPGACAESLCTDSDGGRDIFQSGTASGTTSIVNDRCEDNLQLSEAYCSGQTAMAETIPCPKGFECLSGACVKALCSDSDNGKDEAVKGTVTAQGESSTDECAGAGSVKEYYCDGSEIADDTIACGTGMECANGACREATCTDSDGGKDTSVKGTTTKGTESSTDTCVGTTSVKEYLCTDNEIASETMQCGSGYSCNAGKCVRDVCTDTDSGKDTAVKGTVTYGNKTNTDSCYSSTTVLEYYCSSETTILNEKISCGSGKECADGKCSAVECDNNLTEIDDQDERYEIIGLDDGDELLLYADEAVEINDGYIVKLQSVSGNNSVFRLYDNYAKYKDDDERCSVTIAKGDNDEDFCGKNTVKVEVLEVNDSEDNAQVAIDEYYAVQYYSQEGAIDDWTDNPICPDDVEEYDSHVSEFYPYLDTVSSGLNLDGETFKLFNTEAEIVEVTEDTFTFQLDGDEYELGSGDTFEYMDVEYEATLTFNDGGLFKFKAEPS
ncbi:hypothetical protein H0O00_04805 [Candidatus Micrarchaeota archaeon]|nr:hypothetical protein [Candidatus Micrarchaeota archaeon]